MIAVPGSRWLQSPCLARRKARGRPTRALALDTRAMVNVDFSPALILGMGLIAGGLALYQLRRLQPDISRDFDVIVSAVATFSGGILIFQVWCDVSQDIGQDFYKSTQGVSVIPCNRSSTSVTVLLQSMFRDHQLNMTRYAEEEHVIGCVILCRGCLAPICSLHDLPLHRLVC